MLKAIFVLLVTSFLLAACSHVNNEGGWYRDPVRDDESTKKY